MVASLEQHMVQVADLVEQAIAALVPDTGGPEAPLWKAMRYGTLGGGKRLRPFLVLSSAAVFGVERERALRAALAVELVHSYSLIHDDLPAMDDAALRRGRPSVHRAFDEATAILAGDGLLTYAFEVLADPATHADPAVRCELVTALAQAAGPNGMVGGQMVDLVAETTVFGLDQTIRLQRMKTGALIGFSCLAGAILARAAAEHRAALAAYAADLGLAFQITDDLLDIEGTEAEVGKTVGHDREAGKATFVSLLGLEGARTEAHRLADRAIGQLAAFGEQADRLRAIARFVVERHR